MSVRVPSLNHVAIGGRAGRDPQVRRTSGGKAVARFSLCHNRRIRDGDAWRERSTWIDIVAWDGVAERVMRGVRKGTALVVCGRIEEERWEQDGQSRTRLVIVASSVDAIESSDSAPDRGDARAPSSSNVSAAEDDGDIPF